jgi:hypothetical protein
MGGGAYSGMMTAARQGLERASADHGGPGTPVPHPSQVPAAR